MKLHTSGRTETVLTKAVDVLLIFYRLSQIGRHIPLRSYKAKFLLKDIWSW